VKKSTATVLTFLFLAPGAFTGAAGSAAAGKAVFQEHCAVCHGADATGKTPMAKALGGIPDFHSKTVQSLTDAQIRTVITEGKEKMPPVRNLSDAQIANVIAFIRSLGKK
jgi:cytochrome c6